MEKNISNKKIKETRGEGGREMTGEIERKGGKRGSETEIDIYNNREIDRERERGKEL
jgi:hypothetical protein